MQGSELKARRKGLRLTQEELAAHFGVTGTTVANWEQAETVPNAKLLGYALAGLEQQIGVADLDFSASIERVRHRHEESVRRQREMKRLLNSQ